MFEDTPLVMVEDQASLAQTVDVLAASPVIGIDTESDSSYAYQEKVCLIQISDLSTDYIVDPLSIDDLSPLKGILADRSIVKVLHGADYDVVCLGRDFDFRIRGLFDTLIAAQLLGMERIGLADLIARFFGVELDKQYQRYNWGLRPLLPEHVDYARGDTHFLLALREIMLPRLRRLGRTRHLREECRLLERRRWTVRPFDPEGWRDIKHSGDLDEDGMRVLRQLFLYRDQQARKMDRPVYKVIPDGVLVSIAQSRPETTADLDALFRRKSALRRRHGAALVKAVEAAMADDAPLPKTTRRKTRQRPKTTLRTRLRGRQAERVMASLKRWRNDLLERDPTLTPFTVASNATLKWIASMRPMNLEELEQVPEVRRWQVHDYGEEILELLDRIASAD